MFVFPIFPFMSSPSLIFSSHITAMNSALLPRLLPCNAFGNQRFSSKSEGLTTQLQVPKDWVCHAKRNSCVEKLTTAHHLTFSNYSVAQLQDSTESIFERRKFKSYLNATLDHASGNEPTIGQMQQFWKKLNILYHFCRAYALMGTITGVVSASLASIESMADLTPTFLVGVLKALIPALLMGMYSVAVNEISDVEIDRINKPYLPLASGELPMAEGIAVTAAFACLSITLAIIFQSTPLLCTILLHFLFGCAYSMNLPYLRWKLSTFLAPFAIVSMRSIVVPIGIYAHTQMHTFGRPFIMTRLLVFRVVALALISLVISIFKDIPDVKGDESFGSTSLCIRIGKERVFRISISLLLTGFLASMVLGASSSSMINKLITVVGHGILALVAWLRAQSVDLENDESTHSYYMLIWRFFYAENFLSVFMR